MKWENIVEERYVACMILAALGDTIGFKNGEWEFYIDPYGSESSSPDEKFKIRHGHYSLIDEFIKHGGYSRIDFTGWDVSDDTILHMAVAQSFIRDYKSEDELISFMISKLVSTYPSQKLSRNKHDRLFGIGTLNKLGKLKNNENWKDFVFSAGDGGSGGAMRTMCIGLVYHKHEQLKQLIRMSMINGLLTHTSPMGFLGSVVSALFTSYAIQQIDIEKWIPYLLALFESKIILDILQSLPLNKNDDNNRVEAYNDYVDRVKIYYNNFIADKKFKYLSKYLSYRYSKFLELITPSYNKHKWLGSTGIDSVLFSYETLRRAGDNYEKLIYYAMLHNGDSDTVGTISSAWYGALYGFKDIPPRFLKDLEFRNILSSIGNKLYTKFK